MRKTKDNNGITLIALIITIIVLLILAGVTISMVVGDNGVLKQAMNAKEKTDEAIRKEKSDFDKSSELADELVNGIESAEQVVDEHPGELEDDSEIKVINSIEDLVVFAYDVTNGNTYSGETVRLGLSLDFKSAKSYVDAYRTDYGKYGYNGELKKLLTSGEGFIPIGTNSNESGYENKSFKGTFDGNGKVIKNLYINRKIEDNKNDFIIGLFGYNYGTIKKLGVENCNNSGNLTTTGQNTCMVGGIIGRNYSSIEECFVSGSVVSICNTKSRCGGICSVSDEKSEIIDCYNLATINCIGGSQANVAGGISGISSGNLENCFNNGEVLMTYDGDTMEAQCHIGGVCGKLNTKGEVKANVQNCYNLSTITLNLKCKIITCGGVIGDVQGDCVSCYNKGDINALKVESTNYIGEVIGLIVNGCNAKDCSSLKFSSYKACGGNADDSCIDNVKVCENETEMPDIVDVLGEKFKNSPNGYPILNWQK